MSHIATKFTIRVTKSTVLSDMMGTHRFLSALICILRKNPYEEIRYFRFFRTQYRKKVHVSVREFVGIECRWGDARWAPLSEWRISLDYPPTKARTVIDGHVLSKFALKFGSIAFKFGHFGHCAPTPSPQTKREGGRPIAVRPCPFTDVYQFQLYKCPSVEHKFRAHSKCDLRQFFHSTPIHLFLWVSLYSSLSALSGAGEPHES